MTNKNEKFQDENGSGGRTSTSPTEVKETKSNTAAIIVIGFIILVSILILASVL